MQIQQQQRGRRSRQLTYKKVNSYSRKPSFEQILTIILFVVVLVLYSVFLPQAISQQDSSILWIMLAITYIFLIIIFIDYFILTCEDPVDDQLLGIKKHKENELRICKECRILVHKSSYHCHSCNRCVQYFDHHCKYLNNCIGGKNYTTFIRLLVVVTIFCIVIIGQGIWIFIFSQWSGSFDNKIISRWGVLASIIFTFIMMFTVDTLLCFHLYLLFVLKKTTLAYLQSLDTSQSSKQQIAENH